MSLFFAKPDKPVFVNIVQPGLTVAGLYTIEPVALQRCGTQRYYQRARLKPFTNNAFSVITKLILIFSLVAGYSSLSLGSAINRISKTTLNYWASMTSVLMLAVLVVIRILKLITLIRLKVKNVWELILKCNFASFVTLSKVIQQFGKAQKFCGRNTIEQNLVVISELRATLCKNRQDTAEWILLLTDANAVYSDGRYAGCINVTFNKAFPLRWSTCFGTKRVTQWTDFLPTRYISQEQRSLVLISFVASWSLLLWASGNDELVRALRDVQQLAYSQAETVVNWTSEQVSARQLLHDKFNKTVINKISTVLQCAHPIRVVTLAIVLVALAVTLVLFVSLNPMLKLFMVTMAAVLFLGPLRCTYTDYIDDAANQVKVASALRGKHKRIEYRARLMRNQALETLETQVTLILQNTIMARLDYGQQQITELTYGLMRRGLLITDVVKSTTKCDSFFSDDKEVALSTYGKLNLTSRQPPDKSTLTLR